LRFYSISNRVDAIADTIINRGLVASLYQSVGVIKGLAYPAFAVELPFVGVKVYHGINSASELSFIKGVGMLGLRGQSIPLHAVHEAGVISKHYFTKR
jgi:hypothetical protein